MKPVSIASSPSGVATRWVSAWPPRRSSASKRVTWAVREATHAAVSPATPEPTTAMRRGRGGHVASVRSKTAIGSLVGCLEPPSGSTVMPTAAAAPADPVEDDGLVGLVGHQPGGDELVAVDEPQLVVLARRGGDHVLGGDHCPVLGLRPGDGRAACLAEVDGDRLRVGGLQDLLGRGQALDVVGRGPRLRHQGADPDDERECRRDQKGQPAPPPCCRAVGVARRGGGHLRGERADLGDAGEDRVAQRRRRRDRDGLGQQRRRLAELGDLGPAVVARRRGAARTGARSRSSSASMA